MFTPTNDARAFDRDAHDAARKDPGRTATLVCLGIFMGVLFTGTGALIWERWESRPSPARAALPAARKLAPADPRFTIRLDPETARVVAGAVVVLVAVVLLVVVPTVLPPVLSRRGYLSIGRWLLMAGFCAFVATGGSLMLLIGHREFPLAAGFFYAAAFLPSIPAAFGVAGCLLAAAVYPKSPPGSAP